MMRAYRELMGKNTAPEQKTLDDYMRWTNVVLRVAAMLLPYERPTYRSIEVRTDHIEGDRRRMFDNPREELNRLILGAVLTVQARMDAAAPPPEASSDGKQRGNGRMCVAEAMGRPRCVGICENPRDCSSAPEPAPVDNGDGVLS
jgi:hypothetical protein